MSEIASDLGGFGTVPAGAYPDVPRQRSGEPYEGKAGAARVAVSAEQELQKLDEYYQRKLAVVRAGDLEAPCAGQYDVFDKPGDYIESSKLKAARDRLARAMCNHCTIREDCLADALASDGKIGIWGGLSEHERSRLASKRRG